MRVYTTETVISPEGIVHLEALPFPAGQIVDVIVLARKDKNGNRSYRSLKGTVIKYDYPLEPVAVDDWDASQ